VRKFDVPILGINPITKTDSHHSHNIWGQEHQIHYLEGDIVIYIRNGDIIQLSVRCYKSIKVHQGTCFSIFAILLDMKRRIATRST
jgi:hypothetical protein